MNYRDVEVQGGGGLADERATAKCDALANARRRRELGGPHAPEHEVACTCRECGAVSMIDKAQVDYQARRGHEYVRCYVCAQHADGGRWGLTAEARAEFEAETAARLARIRSDQAAHYAAYKASLDAFYKRAKLVRR